MGSLSKLLSSINPVSSPLASNRSTNYFLPTLPDLEDDKRKPLTPMRRIRYLFEWLFLSNWARGLRLLPRGGALAVGAFLGFFAYFLLSSDRRVAMANLDIALGKSRSAWQKRRIALAGFQRTGKVIMGMIWAPRSTPASTARVIDATALAAVLETLKADRRGAVVVTAHYGDWELGCLAMGHAGLPVLLVAEPLANTRLERLLDDCRTCSGNRTIPPKYAVLKLFRALRQGERVGIMCDINGRRGRGGVWSNFFGLPVYNGVAMAELTLRTGAALVFVAIEPTTHGRHRIVPTVIEPQTSGDHSEDVRLLTQQVTNLCEQQIRHKPEPWLWTNKRWKRQPTPDRGNFPWYSNYKRVQ